MFRVWWPSERPIVDLNQVTYLTYLFIILVVAVALAPLLHFVPSKRQRKIAGMREYAALHGLFVEFRNLPGVPREREHGRVSAPRGDIIYYGRRLQPQRGKSAERCSWIVDEQGWRGLQRRDTPPDLLLQLPPSVLAASVDEGSCGVYWQESGDPAEVELVVSVLGAWSGQLRP